MSGDVLYEINADGFRGPRYQRPKPAHTFRIVVLGDSIAFGYGVEETAAFPHLLEADLAGLLPGQRVEVVNLGVNGYNPYNEEELLADVGVTYQPDLVLVEFCINDLNDPTLHFDAQTLLHLGVIPDASFSGPTLRRRISRAPAAAFTLCRHSRLCTLANYVLLPPRQPDAASQHAAFAPNDGSPGPE